MKHILKKLSWHFLITGLPLVVYPMVFVASIMSLAAANMEGDYSAFFMLIVQGFLWLSVLYPIAYVGSAIATLKSKSKKWQRIWRLFPYAYLGICLVLFYSWLALGE